MLITKCWILRLLVVCSIKTNVRRMNPIEFKGLLSLEMKNKLVYFTLWKRKKEIGNAIFLR
jgi:hypothetical protein